jgi:hypothetical protein
MFSNQSMTSAEFGSKYQLGRPIAEQPVRSYEAVESATGRAVMVHYLGDRASGETARLLSLIERLDPAAKASVLEVIEVDASLIVVTQAIDGFETLDRWLSARAPRKIRVRLVKKEPDAPPQPGGATPPGPASPAPGEFTRLFQQPAPQPAPPASKPPSVNREPPRPPPAGSPVGPPVGRAGPPPLAPGEFTRVFGRSDVATPDHGISMPPPPPTAPTDSDKRPAIRMNIPRTPTEPVKGEVPPAALPPHAFPRTPPRSATELFGASPVTPREARPPEIPMRVHTPPAQPPAAPPSPSAGSSAPLGPSEFTRVLGLGAPASLDVSAPPDDAGKEGAAAGQASAQRSALVPLLLVLSTVLLAVAGVVAYLVLKR